MTEQSLGELGCCVWRFGGGVGPGHTFEDSGVVPKNTSSFRDQAIFVILYVSLRGRGKDWRTALRRKKWLKNPTIRTLLIAGQARHRCTAHKGQPRNRRGQVTRSQAVRWLLSSWDVHTPVGWEKKASCRNTVAG